MRPVMSNPETYTELNIGGGAISSEEYQLRYIRQGECKRCGKCCLTADCKFFEMGEKATCKIHDEERSVDCELFPEAPPIMFKDCGFYFLDTWKDNRIVRPMEI